jgi:hypothetical protein
MISSPSMGPLETKGTEQDDDDIEITKRKQVGRSGRRRKAKLRAIHEAEEQMWKGEESLLSTETAVPVPTDRDKILPGVLERRSKGWNAADEAALVGQLGYLPGNAICVAAHSDQVPDLPIEGNVPIVLKLYPLASRDVYAGGKSDGRKFKGRKRGRKDSEASKESPDGTRKDTDGNGTTDGKDFSLLEPFPTLYWLTHPILRTLTSKLELGNTHNATIMEKRLEDDKAARESMARAHKAYGEERWNLLVDADVKLLEERKWVASVGAGRGVAGIRHPIGVKCLHAMLAHYLSRGPGSQDNVVGKWVYREICRLVKERKENSSNDASEVP